MKKNYFYLLDLLVILCFGLSFSSCSSDEDNNENPNDEVKFDSSVIGFYYDETAYIWQLGRGQSAYREFTDKKTFHVWTITLMASSNDTTCVSGTYFADGKVIILNYPDGGVSECNYLFRDPYLYREGGLVLCGSVLLPRLKANGFKYDYK